MGIAGSGMSALAQFQAMAGGVVSGSDRGLDAGSVSGLAADLKKLDISLFSQDGSGVNDFTDAVVVSTAIEDGNPDILKAQSLDIPVVHRSEVLAEWVSRKKTIAVSGTSGKSTVVAMLFEMLQGAGFAPSIITGGNLVRLREEGYAGNAFSGGSDILVVEADESDGSLVKYSPFIGCVLNIEKDHKEIDELKGFFRTFLGNSLSCLVGQHCRDLAPQGKPLFSFGMGSGATVSATDVACGPDSSTFVVSGVRFELPMPGMHNVENALAAIAACCMLSIPVEFLREPLRMCRGVERRFQLIAQKNGIQVIDDFAHNPTKVRAALATAQKKAQRVLAVFQLHGFGPARFLKNEFIQAFAGALRPGDCLYMPEIYFAGGTVTRDISSEDIINGIREKGKQAFFFPSRAQVFAEVLKEARAGDCILIMGARDPGLPEFARTLADSL